MAIVVKNTIHPTISSNAAIEIKASVTGPFVLNSRTIESAGAGAVARAIQNWLKSIIYYYSIYKYLFFIQIAIFLLCHYFPVISFILLHISSETL